MNRVQTKLSDPDFALMQQHAKRRGLDMSSMLRLAVKEWLTLDHNLITPGDIITAMSYRHNQHTDAEIAAELNYTLNSNEWTAETVAEFRNNL